MLEKASVLCYRIFDIAEGIDLERARALLAQDSRRLRLTREGSEYLLLPNPPLTVELGRHEVVLARNGSVTADVSARVFDHGAASIIVRVPLPAGMTLEQLIPVADELYDSPAINAFAAEQISQLRQAVATATEVPHLWSQNESYSVIFVERITGAPKAEDLFQGADLSRLLLGEVGDRPLSARERSDVVEQHFSYTENDLVVIDWNAAFVYEPSGSTDIPDLLEIANAQLLELRYYDDVLDIELRRTYEQMGEQQRRGWSSLFWSPYKSLARRLVVTLMELSEFIERVENSLKIVGDFYLAKVYEAAVTQLRVSSWQASVTRKQRLLTQAYDLLKGEVTTDRSLLLEATIVLLILVEMLIAFSKVWEH